MRSPFPPQAKKYFWGDDLNQLNWVDHKNYIIQTLLDKGDAESIHWLLQQTNRQELSQLLPSLRLSPKSKNFWHLYFS